MVRSADARRTHGGRSAGARRARGLPARRAPVCCRPTRKTRPQKDVMRLAIAPACAPLTNRKRRGNNSNQRLAFSSKSSSRRSEKRSRGREKSGWHPGARLEPRPSAAHHVAARHVAGGHGLVPRPVGRTPPRGGLRDLATPRYKKEPYIASPTATPCAASGPCRHPSPARARRPRAAPRTTTSPVVAAVCE
jgi:hypothetical protein